MVNPFRKQNVTDFEGIYTHLGVAERNSSASSSPIDKTIEQGERTSSDALNVWTIESLRAEIDRGTYMNCQCSFLQWSLTY